MSSALAFTKVAQSVKNLAVIGCKNHDLRIIKAKNRFLKSL